MSTDKNPPAEETGQSEPKDIKIDAGGDAQVSGDVVGRDNIEAGRDVVIAHSGSNITVGDTRERDKLANENEISEITRRLLVAKTPSEIRRIKHEADALAEQFPHIPRARELREDAQRLPAERASPKPEHKEGRGTRLSNVGCVPSLIIVAILFAVGLANTDIGQLVISKINEILAAIIQ